MSTTKPHPVRADDGHVLALVHRDRANPRWWVADAPDGTPLDLVDATTRRDAVDAVLGLHRQGVLR